MSLPLRRVEGTPLPQDPAPPPRRLGSIFRADYNGREWGVFGFAEFGSAAV